MQFDPNNTVVKLCSEGIAAEGNGEIERAKQLYQLAWDNSTNHFERYTAAHYLARNHDDTNLELHWNLIALQHAEAIHEEGIEPSYPSLHLNIGKSYERLGDITAAEKHYKLAANFIQYLPEDGYGRMIRSGIDNALKRVQQSSA